MFKERFQNNIQFRFLSIICVILFIGTLGLSIVISINERRVLKNTLLAHGQSLAVLIARQSREGLVLKDYLQLDVLVNDLHKEDIVYSVVRDEQGNLLTSQFASVNYQSPRFNNILLRLPRNSGLQDIIDGVKKLEPIMEISVPVMVGIKPVGKVTIGISEYGVNTQIEHTILFIVALNAAVALVLGVVLFTASKKIILNPVTELACATSAIAEGNFSTQIDIQTVGEMKVLVDSFNKMAARLKEQKEGLEKAYNDLKSAHTQILQQEKMAAIGQLAAGVAHEINNPTGFIMSNLGCLQKYAAKLSDFIQIQTEAAEELSGSPEEDAYTILNRVKEQRHALKVDYVIEDLGNLVKESLAGAERIKRIVQDLKSFSHANDTEFQMADINAGINSTLNIVWNELKYKATVKKEYGDIPLTKCNLGQLNQVFMNLFVNASQAIEKQGEIAVRTWSDDALIHISISDTGCGIPREYINKIFDPFFTTKEIGKGTGLGMSIAYDIVKKHKGEIHVQSEPGQGTVFTIQIPIMRE